MRRLSTEEASRHYLASGARLGADPVLLESAEWQLLETKTIAILKSRHRGGQEDKRLGSEAAHQQPTLQPTSVLPSG